MTIRIRPARMDDIPCIRDLMYRATAELQHSFLTETQIAGSFEVMSLDRRLIEDETYLVAEIGNDVAGCGGWSFRNTLYGGDTLAVRDDTRLDPSADAARLRAFYTHPDFVRRGIGQTLVTRCETEAWLYGFSTMELVATLAGASLYESCGYRTVRDFCIETVNGGAIPAKEMSKPIAPAVASTFCNAESESRAA